MSRRAEVTRNTAETQITVRVDLDGVTDIDARGLGMLAELTREARAGGGRVSVVCASQRVRKRSHLLNCGIYAGSGAPNNANGTNGDYYFRSDGTQAGNTCIYHREGGTWVALVTT